jgi:chloride channel protein, CIC family
VVSLGLKSFGKYTSVLTSFVAVIVTGLLFGLVMALMSNGFVKGVQYLSDVRGSVSGLDVTIGTTSLSLAPLCGLLLAVVAILIIRRLFKISRFHGPADSIYAAHRTDNELDVRAGIGSTLAAFVSAAGGGSVGQYGPLVHFGATMGSFMRQHTGGMLSTDVFIGCGVAGAIAAGFNAPIAGIIFAHEAILRHFSLRAIAPIAIASITAAGVSKWMFGDSYLFAMDNINVDLIGLLPAALLAGPLFGLIAVLFMMSIRHSARFAASSGWSPARLLITAAVGAGIVGMWVPEALGLGTSAISDILNSESLHISLILLLIAKIGLTALCIGFGMFGGVFSPALLVGASAGAIMGRIFASVGILSAGPGMAICGMAAVASAVIGAPISGVLIILELTMSYEFAVAAMLSVVTCSMVAHFLFGHSFFDRQLLDRGIDVSLGRGHIEMMETYVADIAHDDYVHLDELCSAQNAIKIMLDAKVTESYVLDKNDKFKGKLTLHLLLAVSPDSQVIQHIESNPISIKHDASLQQAIEIASNFVGENIPVIDRDNNVLLGVVTEADLFKLYLGLQGRVADLERA